MEARAGVGVMLTDPFLMAGIACIVVGYSMAGYVIVRTWR